MGFLSVAVFFRLQQGISVSAQAKDMASKRVVTHDEADGSEVIIGFRLHDSAFCSCPQ